MFLAECGCSDSYVDHHAYSGMHQHRSLKEVWEWSTSANPAIAQLENLQSAKEYNMFTHGQKNDPTFRVVRWINQFGGRGTALVGHLSCTVSFRKQTEPHINKSSSCSKFRHSRRLTPTRLFHVRVSGLFIAPLLW